MTSPFNRPGNPPSPSEVLSYYNKHLPGAFRNLDAIRARNHRPAHLFCDTDEAVGALQLLEREGIFPAEAGPHLLGPFLTLAAWRATQQIFEYAPELYEALMDAQFAGDLPTEVIQHLPAWCIYIKTPDFRVAGEICDGFWFHFERQSSQGSHVMHFTFNTPTGDKAISIDIAETLEEGFGMVQQREAYNVAHHGYPEMSTHERALQANVFDASKRVLNLVLYLCSEEPDAQGNGPLFIAPLPVKTKKGLRMMPPDAPAVWSVGERIGAALRMVKGEEADEALALDAVGQESTSPRAIRPHVRRAHWHKFRTGPRSGAQTWRVKWLPPIFVKVDQGADLPVVTRPVIS